MPAKCWVTGPVCRGTPPAGWGPGLPRHRTWTSHSHDWCPLAAHRRSGDSGITQNWSRLRMCRVRWYNTYLWEKSKRVLQCPRVNYAVCCLPPRYFKSHKFFKKRHYTFSPASHFLKKQRKNYKICSIIRYLTSQISNIVLVTFLAWVSPVQVPEAEGWVCRQQQSLFAVKTLTIKSKWNASGKTVTHFPPSLTI